MDKPTKVKWVDELERADELTEPLGVQWVVVTPELSAYRMTVHKTTGITPNMAMLGREVMMPAALFARPPEEPFTTSLPFVSNLRDTLRDAHRRVRNSTKSSARSQKSYYDERAHVNPST